MSTQTETPPTNVSGRVRIFGLACLVGGVLWLALNLSGVLVRSLGPPPVQGVLGMLLLSGLMGGPLGLIALGAAGGGRMGRIGAVVALLGLSSYLVGQTAQTVLGLPNQEIGIFYALGALLVGVGMLPLGIAVLLSHHLIGWRRLAPFSVGLYYAAMIPVQIVFFIGPNGTPSATLLAFWGVTWALLGYAVFTEAGRR